MSSIQAAAIWREMQAQCRPFDLSGAERLVVAVSGGADSVALLDLLHTFLPSGRLVVAHLDHQLRPAAAADAAFVRDLCRRWRLPLVETAVDVAALAAAQQIGLEAAGRLARYAFLARMAAERGATAVVTGHHADDQIETMLLHLLRGAGTAGLRGMLPVSPLPQNTGILLLRPLLTTPGQALRAYCTARRLPYREDASNDDPRFFRNRMRHELLPLLRKFEPQAERHLLQTAQLLAADMAQLTDSFAPFWQELLVDEGEDWLRLSRARFQAASLSRQRMVVRRTVQLLRPGVEIGFRAVEAARRLALAETSGTGIDLPGGLRWQVGYAMIGAAGEGGLLPVDVPQVNGELLLPLPGELDLGGGWRLQATMTSPPSSWKTDPWEAYLALPAAATLHVRGRLPGEQMQPLGMGGRHSSLKKVMINRRIERRYRAGWPLVVAAGHPVWLVGQIIDFRARLRGGELQVVHLRCRRAPAARLEKNG